MQNVLNIYQRIYINWNVSNHLEMHANMKTIKVRTVKNKFKKVILCH